MQATGQKNHTTITVPLGPCSYDIYVGTGLLTRVKEMLDDAPSRVFIITHPVIDRLHGAALRRGLKAVKAETIHVPQGEGQKSLTRAQELWSKLLARGADRQAVIIAFGGGVIGDLAGFVAATYMRGLPYVQVPTTLLAQVDAAVGGKVAINLPQGKNLVGAFYQPKAVIADVSTLLTLTHRDYREGLAEVVKTALIADASFFHCLKENVQSILERDTTTLAQLVRRCCEIKAAIVAADEKEAGLRALLNFGHTIGHALESLSGYGTLRHGEAVAIGLAGASRLSRKLGRLTEEDEEAIIDVLSGLGLPTSIAGIAATDIFTAMAVDKKSQAGIPRFVLLTALGQAEWGVTIPRRMLRATLRELGAT